MFLNELEKVSEKYITKLSRDECTYGYFYVFWKEHLFERLQKLFIYNGLPDTLPQKEIEVPLYLRGHVGICHYKNELSAFNGSFYGVTKYVDEYTQYNCFCPIDTFTKTINKDIIVIDNTSLRNSIMPLIHHYSCLLAHNDVTLMDALINVRDCGGVPVATNEKQKKSIEEYQTKIYKGQYGVITDIGNQGLNFVGGSRGTGQSLKDIFEVREKLIKSFYQSIGIRGSFEKTNNAVDSEVTSDNALLQLNIHDMLECRKKGVEKVNNLFGTNITVELSPEIKNSFEMKGSEDNAKNSKADVSEM